MIAGTLEVQMFASMARLQNDMNQAKRVVGGAMDNINSAVAKTKSVLGMLGVGVGVHYFANLILGSQEALDHLNDLSKTTRLTVETLSGLQLAAKDSGSDLDGTAKAINKLAKEMGTNAEKFKAIGITAKDPLTAFGQLADILNAIEDPQQRAAVAATALGKGWETAAPLIAEGSKKIAEMVQKGKELSGITKEDAEKADKFNEKIHELEVSSGRFGRFVAQPIVDGLGKIFEALNKEIGAKPGSIIEWMRHQGGSNIKTGQQIIDAMKAASNAPVAPPAKPTSSALKNFVGGGGDDPMKKALSEYEALKKSIIEKTAAEKAEYESTTNLTGAQKEYAQWLAMVNAHLTKMTPKQIENSKALWDSYLAQAALNKEKQEQEAAMKQARQNMEKEIAATVKAIEERDAKITEFSRKAAQNIQDSMANFLFDPFSKGLSGMLDGFTVMVRRMVAEAAAAELAKKLFGASGGLSGGILGPMIQAGLGAFGMGGTQAAAPVTELSTAFTGFATGTDFVPRDGLYRLHRGERVDTAAENSRATSAVVINIGVTGAVDSRTQMQIAQQAGNAVSRAMRRNG